MRKLVAVLTAAVLMAVLAFPSTAFAFKGGNGKVKSIPPGQAKKEAPVEPGAKSQKPDKGVDAIDSEDGDDVADPAEDATQDERSQNKAYKNKHREQVMASEDGSGAVEPKKTGVSNALTRIEANLARAQQKVLNGTKRALPPGLVHAYSKFMTWLGLTPEAPAPDETVDPDEGVEDSGPSLESVL
ncbi:MAG: hypothetical protein JXE06_08680 [Coriobacteriia bacterium]|nr:hypothetical protein [Coriobacteriia bacterium]MBN2823134.1 hypothetical protein [Coriobacteriia bacterium]